MYNQSDIMPKIEKLERQIKVLIVFYAIYLLSKQELEKKIMALITIFANSLPKDLINRQVYIDGVYKSSKVLINKFYVPTIHDIFTFGSRDTKPIDLLKVKKGTPNVIAYKRKIEKRLKGFNRWQLTTHEPNKKPISLWQMTELDLRHESQMKMVIQARASGNDLFWLSSHADCSVRCEKWQGKLVSMSLPAIDKTFRTSEMIDGNIVYSFNAIENVIDKYGYKNNIINGFNCRHRLIAYKGEKNAPIDYSSKDIKRERLINAHLREYERRIRKMKMASAIYSNINKNISKEYLKNANILTKEYKRYAKANGFKPEMYRLEV